MRSGLRRAGWALAAAGGIGMAGPAVAQSPPARIIGPGGEVMPAGDTTVMSESQARMEEAQVELRLLADPMLFSYGLGAHVQGAALEVRGFVPTEAQREQAVKLAREQTTLPVVDKLKVAPNLVTRSSIDKPVNIQRAAKELLEESFPEHGRGMDVSCDARGRVTVTGGVGSVEDKVQVSRKLRQVLGCSCVVNQLGIAAVAHGVPSGEVPPGASVTAPPQPAPARPPVIVTPAVKRSDPGPFPARPVAAPAKKEKESDLPTLGMPRVQAPAAPAPLSPPPLPAAPAVPPRPAPVIEVAPPKAPPVVLPVDLPPGGATKPAPAVKLPEVVTHFSSPAPSPPPLPPVPLLPPVPSKPATTATAPALPPTPVKATATTTAPALPPVPSLPSRAPAGSKHDVGGGEESFVTEGTISFGDDPPPAKPAPATKPVVPDKSAAPAKPAAPDKPVAPAKPAVWGARSQSSASPIPAEGTLTLTPPPMPPSKPSAPVTLTAAPAKLPPPPAPPAPPRPTVPPAVRLKERIQGVCGPGYEVVVMAKAKNSLQVSVAARSKEDGERLWERIKPVLQSPEFTTTVVDVDITLPTK